MSSVSLPVHRHGGQPPGPEREVGYELLDLPYPTERLWGGGEAGLLSEGEAGAYVGWIRTVEADRVRYATGCLARAGAPVQALPDEPEALKELTPWLQGWVADIRASWPGGDPRVLQASLSHDVALVVVAAARAARPQLEWAVSGFPLGVRVGPGDAQPVVRLPCLRPGAEQLIPTREIHQLIQSAWRRAEDDPRMAVANEAVRQVMRARHNRLVAAQHEKLFRIFEALVAGRPLDRPAPGGPVAGGAVGGGPGRGPDGAALVGRRSAGPGAAADPAVTAAVTAYRRAGWFGDRSGTPVEVAAGLEAEWSAGHGGALAEPPDRLDVRLLTLDRIRTVCDDIEADAGPGNRVYESLLSRLAAAGGAMEMSRAVENWAPDGTVEVRFDLGGRPRRLILADCGDMIDPTVVTGLNGLLPGSGPRFWFVDGGAQQFVVTRATEAERDRLQEARPVRLDAEPPPWWTAALER